jgi:hypothetical protein
MLLEDFFEGGHVTVFLYSIRPMASGVIPVALQRHEKFTS